jgi:uncharacterized pyridoxamine 5'-phosphate oxidase family protein
MQEVHDFLKKCGIYYLATVDGNQPHVRPFGTINLFEGRLYCLTDRTKEVAKQILKNPKVEISGFDGENWLRLTTKLVEDPRLAPKVSMLKAYPELKQMYTAEGENTMALYMTDATAIINGIDGTVKTIQF